MKRRFKADKLVRDLVPEIMHAQNIDIALRVMEVPEFIIRLKDKLVEESKEVLKTETKEEILEELADVWEVLETLASTMGITTEQIQERRLLKIKEKGGFNKKLYCDYIEMDSSNPRAEYYATKPEEYPEIEAK